MNIAVRRPVFQAVKYGGSGLLICRQDGGTVRRVISSGRLINKYTAETVIAVTEAVNWSTEKNIRSFHLVVLAGCRREGKLAPDANSADDSGRQTVRTCSQHADHSQVDTTLPLH